MARLATATSSNWRTRGEKNEKIGLYNQHQSNMIHDLIIGKTKQRRARPPRAIHSSRSVPCPPQEGESPEVESRGGMEDMEDLQMIDDCESQGRDKLVSRHRSLSRSVREGSPRVRLPPTPITNPEKFCIRVADKTKPSSSS